MYKSKFSENNIDDSRTVIESKGVSYLPLDFSSESSEESDTQKSYNPLDLLFGNLDTFSNSSVQGVTFNGYNPRYTDLDFHSTGDTDASTNTNETFTKESFKDKMLPLYEQALEAKGLDKSFAKPLVAQDGLETAGGNKAIGQFNYGNITGKSGTTQNVPEYINNELTTINQTFIDFADPFEYVNYKIDLLNSSKYDVFNHPVGEFAQRVKAGGYATAKNYVERLNACIHTLRKGGILKFDGGGYLSRNAAHYNKTVSNNFPSGYIPTNVTRHQSTLYNKNENELVVKHLSKNIKKIIDRGGNDMFNEGVNYDFNYDTPEALGLRFLNYFESNKYHQLNSRDTIQYINNDKIRYVTNGRFNDRGDAVLSYNDPNNIYNRYSTGFIKDMLQLFYGISLNRRGGSIIKKYGIGGPVNQNIQQQVFNGASNKNGELRYAINNDKSYPTFYRLLRDPTRPILDLGDGYTGTHKLSYVQNGDKGYIYPEIQWTQDMNGNGVGVDYSQEDDWKIGGENAYNNGDYLEIPTEEMAEYFTKNYKKAYPKGYPGFDNTETNSLSSSNVGNPDPNFVPTIEDLAKQLTGSYETYRSNPYILETTNKDGSVTKQELIGHGLANKDIIEKYRQTGIPEDVSMNLVVSTLNDLHNTFTKMVPNYSKLPGNVQLAILDTAYNTSGTNFGNKSPKFSALVASGVTDPVKLITQLDHSKGIDSWLGDRSAARRALALGEFRGNGNHTDRYGRHLDPNKTVGSKDWESSLYLGNY